MKTQQWTRLSQRLASVITPNRRLPDRVFEPAYIVSEFMEFDATLTDRFWLVLKHLMKDSGDQSCSLVVVQPDPVEYFFSHFNRYGALSFDFGHTTDDYYDALAMEPEGSPADALLYNSEVIVWLPDSTRWAIWGERSLGIAMIAVDRRYRESVTTPLLSLGLATPSVERALRYVEPNIQDADARQAFSRRFKEAYGEASNV